MWIDRMYNDIVTLYRLDISQDESGNEVATLIDPQELFCKTKSIGMKEFYAAATTDMLPELTVVLADEYDYDNQKIAEYGGVFYDISRTYVNGHEVELTLMKRLGTNER